MICINCATDFTIDVFWAQSLRIICILLYNSISINNNKIINFNSYSENIIRKVHMHAVYACLQMLSLFFICVML